MANSLYAQRGVSAQKEEVHRAVAQLDPGLYPHAFCKIYPDFLNGDEQWVNLMHADGAGTKSILAYLYWRETGDLSVWKGIAQDAIVMNLDDLLCTGVHERFLFSSTIDRNKKCIPGEVLQALILGTQEFFDWLHDFAVDIHYLGGETADVGDVVRTIAVNGTLMARWPKDRLITNEKIIAGDVIVGLASSGKASYETTYNSGIASNGLTSARHDALHKTYGARFPETYDNSLDESVVYIGPYQLTDEVPADDPLLKGLTLGQLLLSPTRTYAPVMKELLKHHFSALHGLVHCSGGGQTKCLKYLPATFRVVKDQLFAPPVIFDLLQKASGSDDREMYQVFNMGHRLEIFTPQQHAEDIIQTARQFGVDAKVVGRVEAAAARELHLTAKGQTLKYS